MRRTEATLPDAKTTERPQGVAIHVSTKVLTLLCVALWSAQACGDDDGPRQRAQGSQRPEERDDVSPGERPGSEEPTHEPSRVGAGQEAMRDGGSPTHRTDASGPSSQAMEAGTDATLQPALPLADAAVVSEVLGRAYGETQYDLEQPVALTKAFGAVVKAAGDTRLFVNELRAGDAGVEVLYGPADRIDGGLVWQKPPAYPRRFAIGKSAAEDNNLSSTPFKYVLEARVAPTPSSVFRLYLEVEQSVWSAEFSRDYESIVAGELRGVLTREQVEHRPLDRVSCSAACGPSSPTYCSADRELRLATAFDCNGAAPDVDRDGDGINDSYRLILRFRSEQVALPRE